MDPASLTIGRWTNEITVARHHPSPQAVKARVAGIAEAAQHELGVALNAYLERRQGEVILVRSLEIGFDLDLACDTTQAARLLAEHVVQRLVGCIEDAAPQVLRHASAAAYAASFVVDVAAGRADGRWYYEAFDGLGAMNAAARIRTVLTDSDGLDTLAAIDPVQLPSVLGALDEAECWRVLDGLALADDGDALATDATLLDALRSDALAAATPALAIALIASCRRAGLQVDARTRAAAEVVAHGARRSVRTSDPSRGDVAVASVDSTPGRAAARVALHLAGSHGPALRTLVAQAQRVRDSHVGVADASSLNECVEIASPDAGLVILLDELQGLFDSGLQRCMPMPAAARLAVLACASGADRASRVWHDAAWRAVLGVEPKLTWDAFVEALPIDTDARLAYTAQAQRHVRGDVVQIEFREPGALAPTSPRARSVVAIDVDRTTGLWIGATADRTSPDRGLHITRSARADWRALDHPLLHDACPPPWRALFIACAQFAWRRVALRVPGMAGAGLPYLRTNLLSRRGAAQRTAEGWRWRLTRPPLHVLIAMTGLARGVAIDDVRMDVEWV